MELTARLRGKVIEWVATDEKHLVIRCTDGIEVRVVWEEGSGPVFAGQDVKIVLPPPSPLDGSAQAIGG